MSPLKTYIVEDSPVIRDGLIATLEELGPVQVLGWAADEASALQWLGQPGHGAELLIVDLFLRGGSGMGVLRALGTGLGAPRLVVLSNYATPDVRRKCLDMGAERVFDKSSEIEALLAYCGQLAAARPASGAAAG